MKVTYTSTKYRPSLVQKRYVRFNAYDNTFRFCEVGQDRGYDLRQGDVEETELPESVVTASKLTSHYVDWPY